MFRSTWKLLYAYFICWRFFVQLRLFRSYGDFTNAVDGLQIFTLVGTHCHWARRVCLACNTYCYTGLPFIHFSKTTLGLSRLRFEHLTFRLWSFYLTNLNLFLPKVVRANFVWFRRRRNDDNELTWVLGSSELKSVLINVFLIFIFFILISPHKSYYSL